MPTALFLRLPDDLDLEDDPLLALTTAAPTRSNVLVFDPERDAWAGVTLRRASGGQVPADRRLTFGFGGPDEARVAGPASAVVHVASKRVVPRSVTVRARLLVCDASAGNGECAVIGDTTATATLGLVAAPMTFGFGTVDAVIPAGGTIRLELHMPSGDAGEAVVFADTTATRSTLTLTFP